MEGKKGVTSPGDIPEVLTVGAVKKNNKVTNTSGRGPVMWDGTEYIKPDVCAYGAGITTLRHDGDGYCQKSGTSMATPHAAGTAALMLDANPNLKPKKMRDILEEIAKDLGNPGKDNSYGSGLIIVPKAVRAAEK